MHKNILELVQSLLRITSIELKVIHAVNTRFGATSNIVLNHSSIPKKITSGHYLPKFTCKINYRQMLNYVQVGVGTNIAQNHSSSI